MEEFINSMINLGTSVGSKLIFALIALIVGKIVIGSILKGLKKGRMMAKIEGEIQTFVISIVKAVLYVLLIIIVIGILGVPMASVITVLASAGVAVGLALQGALSNLAGGIMLMAMRPFHVGDYISAAGGEGTVQSITLFYTTIVTVDNKTITIPNGSLMNANVTNFSTAENRRVDLEFACGKGENPANVQAIILEAMQKNDMVLMQPDPAFARLSGGTNESMIFTARAWVKSENYWPAYFDLTQSITEALGAHGITAPAVRIVENK